MARRKKKKQTFPKPLVALVQRIEDFLDWIAPAAEWVGEKAEQLKAASDAVKPPTKKWVKNRRVDTRNATVTIFMLFLAVVAVLSLDMSRRPDYSELEQRSLTKFPKPTFVEVLNGAFFNDINTWFADTFPYREQFLSVHSTLEGFYGFRGKSIEGNVAVSDDIPDVSTPAAPAEPAPPQEPESGESSQPTQTVPDTPAVVVPEVPEEPEQRPQAVDDGQSDDYADAETLGALFTNKNTAYEYYNFVQTTADSYIGMVNRAAQLLEGKARVFDMVVPTSIHICIPEKVRKGLNSADQEKAIDYLYQSMSPSVTKLDLMETLQKHQEEKEYLYFRTDHHWTALGAYYAYRQFAPQAGRPTASITDYEERVFEGFLGSFYRQVTSKPIRSAMEKTPDTVYAYAPKSASKMQLTTSEGDTLNYDIIRDGDQLKESQKYLSFIGGDNPWTVIENENLHDGSSVLLVKESFGNCFAPFLVESYQHVYVVDYRHISKIDSRTLTQLVEDYDIDDVLFLNNISATREDSLVQQMAKLVG